MSPITCFPFNLFYFHLEEQAAFLFSDIYMDFSLYAEKKRKISQRKRKYNTKKKTNLNVEYEFLIE